MPPSKVNSHFFRLFRSLDYGECGKADEHINYHINNY